MGDDFDSLGLDSSDDYGFGFEDDGGTIDFGDPGNSTGNQSFDTSGIDLSLDSMNMNNGPTFNQPTAGDSESSSDVKKTALKLVLLGVLILIVILTVGGLVKGPKNKKEQPIPNSANQSISQSQNFNNTSGLSNAVNNQNTPVQVPDTKDDGWKEFSGSKDLVLDADYKELDFTITGVKHYAKDCNGQIRIKTLLTGAISGLPGVYEIEVPYSIGMKCSTSTDPFKVKVKTGKIGDHTIVADIMTGLG